MKTKASFDILSKALQIISIRCLNTFHKNKIIQFN